MFKRYKLQLIFMGLSLTALLFFGVIAYNSSYEIRMKQEIEILNNFAQYLAKDFQRHNYNDTEIINYLKRTEFLPENYLLLIYKNDKNPHAYYPENFNHQIINNIAYDKDSEGSFVFRKNIYTWSHIEFNPYKIVLLHRLPDDSVEKFFRSLGIPLIVTGVLILWLVFWATFMLNSLFIKLKEKNESMQHMIIHDALTGLPNRFLLQDRIEQEIKTARRNGTSFAVIYIDLNRFKEINDTLGHHIGDKLLIELANSLKLHLRDSDTAARLGGDEFAVLAPGANINSIDMVIEKLQDAFNHHYMIENTKLYTDASMGVTFYPDHGTDTTTLMQRADMAMYAAKSMGNTFTIYNPQNDKTSLQKLNLANDLRHAIDEGAFEIYYQPQLTRATQKCDHFEAIIRWNHPENGFISPAEFIPLAESMGLIRSLSQWVLKNVITQCGKWKQQGYDFVVSVNLSTWDIQETSLPERIQLLLTAHQVDSSAIVIEVTETAIMANLKRAKKILNQLKSDGINISLDDFGTGYSSLNHLRHFPIDEVKIDSSFISSMLSNKEDLHLVKAIIDLCHDLNIEVVAEGVEDIQSLNKLYDFNCDRLQGYIISKPVPVAQLIATLSKMEKVS